MVQKRQGEFLKKVHCKLAWLLSAAAILTACGNEVQPKEEMSVQNMGTAQISDELQVIADNSYVNGYSSAAGYYTTVPRENGSKNICYVDYATGREIVLCSQLNCRHDSEACSAWIPTSQARSRVVPVGDKVFLLRCGNPNFADILGDASLAQLEVMNADGTDRQVIHRFAADQRVPPMPRAGMARDKQNLYFAIESMDGSMQRTLYAANIETKQLTPILEMTREEERLVGGDEGALILEYTPGSYNMDIQNLVTQVVRFDPASQTETPLFEHGYIHAGVCENGEYTLLENDHFLRSYDLKTGKLLREIPVELDELFNWNSFSPLGFFDGKLLVYSETTQNYEEAGESYIPYFCYGVDVQSGEAFRVEWNYQAFDETQVPVTIMAETETHFLVHCGNRSMVITQPTMEGKKYKDRRDVQQFGMIGKQDFWNHTGEIIPIAEAEN